MTMGSALLMSEKSQAVYYISGSRLTGYNGNVTRSPVTERLMVRGSQVALKHVIHDMEARTLVMELCRRN